MELNIRSSACAVAFVAGMVATASASAMPLQSASRVVLQAEITPAGFTCYWVCLEHKQTPYGPICSKRAQDCKLSSGPRMMPPPARTSRR